MHSTEMVVCHDLLSLGKVSFTVLAACAPDNWAQSWPVCQIMTHSVNHDRCP